MTSFSRLQAGLSAVRRRFAAALPERAEVLQALQAELDKETGPFRSMEAAQLNLHKIAGTAETLGFCNLGDAARQCEDMIVAHVEAGQKLNVAALRDCLSNVLLLIEAVYHSVPEATAAGTAN